MVNLGSWAGWQSEHDERAGGPAVEVRQCWVAECLQRRDCLLPAQNSCVRVCPLLLSHLTQAARNLALRKKQTLQRLQGVRARTNAVVLESRERDEAERIATAGAGVNATSGEQPYVLWRILPGLCVAGLIVRLLMDRSSDPTVLSWTCVRRCGSCTTTQSTIRTRRAGPS